MRTMCLFNSLQRSKLRDEVERRKTAPGQQRQRPYNKDVDPFPWTGLPRVGLIGVSTKEGGSKDIGKPRRANFVTVFCDSQ